MNDEIELYKAYLREIQRYALLSQEDEEELSRLVEAGDRGALKKLVNSNLRLVVSVAKKFSASRKFSVMDLIQEGNMGLMAAAQKYHYSFNTRFSTYAYSWILQYMLRFVHNRTGAIELPHRKEELLRQINSVRGILSQRSGIEPSALEIAEYLGVGEGEVREAVFLSASVSSLDAECSEDGGETVGDLIPDMTYNPEELFMQKETECDVVRLLRQLPEKERIVIFSRFNFARKRHVATLRELSESLGVSTETVRQLEMRAVKRLRKVCAESAG